jgi:hypothetical protein
MAGNAASENWSRSEVEAIVADYFDMLEREQRGESVNKADHNRGLQTEIDRSRGSIEFKHANISAALLDLGFPLIIDGYKPRYNFQGLLRDIVAEQLDSRKALERTVAAEANSATTEPVRTDRILDTLVPPPDARKKSERVSESSITARKARRADYIAIEAANRALGARGEEFVMAFEHARLWAAGARKLADRIDHVAKNQGDGLGYDILSFETDGKERLVEVKTTRFGMYTPFYASRNEVVVSQQRHRQYFIYRVCNFAKDRKLFLLNGPMEQTCALEPVQYVASVA